MVLSPFHLLSRIEAALVTSHSRGLGRPGVHYLAALGCRFLPNRILTRSRSAASSRSHVPSMRHLLPNQQETVSHAGKLRATTARGSRFFEDVEDRIEGLWRVVWTLGRLRLL